MKRIRTIAVVLAGMLAAILPANAEAVLRDMAIGSDEAPLTVIEYASMTCPHCAEFHIKVLPEVKRDISTPASCAWSSAISRWTGLRSKRRCSLAAAGLSDISPSSTCFSCSSARGRERRTL